MIPAILVIFNINTFSPVGNGDGLSITTIQAKKEVHQPPNLLDQQIAILVDLGINPNWVREQSATGSLIHGIMKPDDTVPAGINGGYSYLIISNHDKKIFLFFKTGKKEATIKYTDHGEKLYTGTVPLSRLVEQSYRIGK